MWRGGRRQRTARIETLIGPNTEIHGDLRFSGGLHIDGRVRGNVIAEGEGRSVLILSEHGRIEGEVRVPQVVLNGTVIGDVHASERVELASKARVTGDVHYNLIEMAIGAEVNGSLVHVTRAQAGAEVAPAVEPHAAPAGAGSGGGE